MDILNINTQIQEARRKLETLKIQKKENETKVKNGEDILSDMEEYRVKSRNAISDFQSKLNLRCNDMPQTLGEHYKEQIQEALKKGGAFDSDDRISDICKTVKRSILDLDSVIESINSKIVSLNNLLKSLGDMLEDAKEAMEGDND